jgi:tRNA(Ile2)-agmatinylcytidine synthase
MINEKSVFKMDKQTSPYTFNNIDSEKKRIIITPRGPDPILFGIRGETAEIVNKAALLVESLEPIERKVIFRTNQGTDAHLSQLYKINQLEPHNSVIIKGIVEREAIIVPKRHLIFSIRDETAKVDCAAYEKTGRLRNIVRKLIPGDYIAVYGGVRAPSVNLPLTINVEKLKVLKIAPKILYSNPQCQQCGNRLKSMGKQKGFRCKKCNLKYRNLKKIEVKIKREIKKGLYITSPRSQRHLTKPFKRYGMEKNICVD